MLAKSSTRRSKRSPTNKHSPEYLLKEILKCEISTDMIKLATRLKILSIFLNYANLTSQKPKSGKNKLNSVKSEIASLDPQILLLYNLTISTHLTILKQMVTSECLKEYNNTKMGSPLKEVTEEAKTGGGSLFNIIILFFIGFMTQIKTVNVNVSQNKFAFSDLPLDVTDAEMDFLSYYPVKEARDQSLVQCFTQPNELSIVQWIELKGKLRSIVASQSEVLNNVLRKTGASHDVLSLFKAHVLEDPEGNMVIAYMGTNKDMDYLIKQNLLEANANTQELRVSVANSIEAATTATLLTAGGAIVAAGGAVAGAAVGAAATVTTAVSFAVPTSQVATYVTSGLLTTLAVKTGETALQTVTDPVAASTKILALSAASGSFVQTIAKTLPLRPIANTGEDIANSFLYGANLFGMVASWYNSYPGLKKELFLLLKIEQAFENTNFDTNKSKLDAILNYVERRTNLIKSIEGLKDPAIFDDVEWTSLRKFIKMVENDNMALLAMGAASKATVNLYLNIFYTGLNIAYNNHDTVIKISFILAAMSMLIIQYKASSTSKTPNRTRRRRRQSLRQIRNNPENSQRIQGSTTSPTTNSNSPLITVTTPDSPNAEGETWRTTDKNGKSILLLENK